MKIFILLSLCIVKIKGQPFESCAEIKTSTPINGDYTISVSGTQYSVYCHNMSGIPTTYITLQNTTSGANQAQWIFGDKLITTKFTKVRFYPNEMRIGTGDFTFSESENTGIVPADYFNPMGPNSCYQPLPAAGTNDTEPTQISVPFGIVGFCHAIINTGNNGCEYNFPALTPKANIDLTGTGLRLVNNPGMDFLYYNDNNRRYGFNTNTGDYTALYADTPPGTTVFSSNNTIMNSRINDTQNTADIYVGFCKWVTTEAWMGEAALNKPLLAEKTSALNARSQAIRSGKGSICVCADNGVCNNDCNYVEKDVVFRSAPNPPNSPNSPVPEEGSSVSVGMIVGIVAGVIIILGVGIGIYVKTRGSAAEYSTTKRLMENF